MPNPFTPTFGSSPPLLVGRDDVIAQFAESLDEGAGSPGRASLYTGARGVGKTVLLNSVEDEARRRGWLVISETAVPGLLDRIAREHLPALLARHDPAAPRRRMTGITAPGGLGAISWQTTEAHPSVAGLRSQISELTDILAAGETGLLLSIDEIHRSAISDLRAVGAVVQHTFREDRPVAFVAAGLPSAVSDLLNDDVLTFLRRADRHVLGAVSRHDVARALRAPIEANGRVIGAEACRRAAEATGNYPFLIQLVGYHIWRQHPRSEEISVEDVEAGAAAARRRLGTLVHEPSLVDLSDVDRSFLAAMAQDEGPSRTADIATRLGVSANYASQYRLRLLTAELIHSPSRGRVDFALPFLREYLRNHAASTFLGHEE